MTDRLVAAGLLAWAAPDVPWWWRPPGHSAATLVVLGYVALSWPSPCRSCGGAGSRCWPPGWPRPCWPSGPGSARIPISAVGGDRGRRVRPGSRGGRRTRLAARILTAAAVTAAAVVLLTSHGFRVQALPLALLATALGLGEVTAANRDAAAAAAAAGA